MAAAHVHGAMGEGAHGHGGPGKEGHAGSRFDDRRRLAIVLVGGVTVMLVEVVAGIAANSLVLLADAAHYATDVGAVLLALVAVAWAQRPADARRSFGHHRAEVLAAFTNGLALLGVSAVLAWEAIERLRDPPHVEGPLVAVVGGLSLVANAALALLLRRRAGVNMRAAYVHLLSDVLGSAAAVAAGLAVHYGGWDIADPLLTIFVTLLIVGFTIRLLRESGHILMQGTPAHLDPVAIASGLRTLPGVRDVHDLHVWHIATGLDSLTAHLVLDQPPNGDLMLHAAMRHLREQHGIRHVTLQLESPGCPCEDLPRH